MTLTTLTSAPRVINVPLAASGVAPKLARLSPFESGQSVLALSAAAGQVFGSCHPGKSDQTRYCTFKIAAADVAVAANVIAQVAAARDASGNVTDDLTVTFGTSGGRLQLGAIPVMTTSISADDLLGAIVIVNGTILARITDANSPNPAAGQWGVDADTDAGYTIVIGASTGTSALRVGSDVEIILPNLALTGVSNNLLCKPGAVAGAALVAGVAEERMLSIALTVTDTAGRSAARECRVDFLAADVGAVALTGLSK